MSAVDWRAALVDEAQAAAHHLGGNERGPALASEVATRAAERGHMMGQSLMAEHDVHFKAVPACAEGCAFCCHQAVLVTTPEAVLLADHLRATLSPDELTALRARLDSVAERTRAWTTASGTPPTSRAPCST